MNKLITLLFLLLFTGVTFAGNPSTEVMFVCGSVVDKQSQESFWGAFM